jgi:hypothetical protein
MGKADLDSPILDLEVNRLHPPEVIEAKQTGVMRLKRVHFGTLPNRRPSMNRPRRATDIPEEQSFSMGMADALGLTVVNESAVSLEKTAGIHRECHVIPRRCSLA